MTFPLMKENKIGTSMYEQNERTSLWMEWGVQRTPIYVSSPR